MASGQGELEQAGGSNAGRIRSQGGWLYTELNQEESGCRAVLRLGLVVEGLPGAGASSWHHTIPKTDTCTAGRAAWDQPIGWQHEQVVHSGKTARYASSPSQHVCC